MARGPDPRFPAGNSPIKGRGWGDFCLHGGENREKSILVGSNGDGDGPVSPVPAPHILAPLRNTSYSRVEFGPSRPTLAHQRIEYIY
jgi:hypothetical protein